MILFITKTWYKIVLKGTWCSCSACGSSVIFPWRLLPQGQRYVCTGVESGSSGEWRAPGFYGSCDSAPLASCEPPHALPAHIIHHCETERLWRARRRSHVTLWNNWPFRDSQEYPTVSMGVCVTLLDDAWSVAVLKHFISCCKYKELHFHPEPPRNAPSRTP